jgi:hypothetical protein
VRSIICSRSVIQARVMVVSPKVISLWDETGPCQAPPTASQATDGQDR